MQVTYQTPSTVTITTTQLMKLTMNAADAMEYGAGANYITVEHKDAAAIVDALNEDSAVRKAYIASLARKGITVLHICTGETGIILVIKKEGEQS